MVVAEVAGFAVEAVGSVGDLVEALAALVLAVAKEEVEGALEAAAAPSVGLAVDDIKYLCQ